VTPGLCSQPVSNTGISVGDCCLCCDAADACPRLAGVRCSVAAAARAAVVIEGNEDALLKPQGCQAVRQVIGSAQVRLQLTTLLAYQQRVWGLARRAPAAPDKW
jgi:hypothetical protein